MANSGAEKLAKHRYSQVIHVNLVFIIISIIMILFVSYDTLYLKTETINLINKVNPDIVAVVQPNTVAYENSLWPHVIDSFRNNGFIVQLEESNIIYLVKINISGSGSLILAYPETPYPYFKDLASRPPGCDVALTPLGGAINSVEEQELILDIEIGNNTLKGCIVAVNDGTVLDVLRTALEASHVNTANVLVVVGKPSEHFWPTIQLTMNKDNIIATVFLINLVPPKDLAKILAHTSSDYFEVLLGNTGMSVWYLSFPLGDRLAPLVSTVALGIISLTATYSLVLLILAYYTSRLFVEVKLDELSRFYRVLHSLGVSPSLLSRPLYAAGLLAVFTLIAPALVYRVSLLYRVFGNPPIIPLLLSIIVSIFILVVGVYAPAISVARGHRAERAFNTKIIYMIGLMLAFLSSYILLPRSITATIAFRLTVAAAVLLALAPALTRLPRLALGGVAGKLADVEAPALAAGVLLASLIIPVAALASGIAAADDRSEEIFPETIHNITILSPHKNTSWRYWYRVLDCNVWSADDVVLVKRLGSLGPAEDAYVVLARLRIVEASGELVDMLSPGSGAVLYVPEPPRPVGWLESLAEAASEGTLVLRVSIPGSEPREIVVRGIRVEREPTPLWLYPHLSPSEVPAPLLVDILRYQGVALIVRNSILPASLHGYCPPVLLGLVNAPREIAGGAPILDYDVLREGFSNNLKQYLEVQAPLVAGGGLLLALVLVPLIVAGTREKTRKYTRLLESLGVEPGYLSSLRARAAALWITAYTILIIVVLYVLIGSRALTLLPLLLFVAPTLYVVCRRCG